MCQQRGLQSIEIVMREIGEELLGRRRHVCAGRCQRRLRRVIIENDERFRPLLPSCNRSLAQKLLLLPKRVTLLVTGNQAVIVAVRRHCGGNNAATIPAIARSATCTKCRGHIVNDTAILADEAAFTGTTVFLRAAYNNYFSRNAARQVTDISVFRATEVATARSGATSLKMHLPDQFII